MMSQTEHSALYERNRTLFGFLTWIVRIFVGGLFIFSGMTKGIDVWGTIYKFNEYIGAFGYEVWPALYVTGVFFLCLVEFLTGVFLVTGCFRRATPVIAALIMAFMLPLTLWLAIANPISDCGCFGDAVKLSNWATFWKNIVITLGVVWLLIYNRRFGWLVTPYLQWIAAVVAGLYFLVISLLGYYYQPLVDFRDYKVGTPLVEIEDDTTDEDSGMVFVYERNGERREFSIDDELPDEEDGWVYVERIEKPLTADSNNVKPVNTDKPVKNLRFYSENGREDLTENAIGDGKQLILMIPDMSQVPAARTWKINALYEWCAANGIEMLATMGGNPMEIEEWKDISLAEYPIYTSDDTSIEEVVRGNPAVVYIENGIIKWKRSLASIDIDELTDKEHPVSPEDYGLDNQRILLNISIIFILALLVLIFLSFTPALGRLFVRHKKTKPIDDNFDEEDKNVG